MPTGVPIDSKNKMQPSNLAA